MGKAAHVLLGLLLAAVPAAAQTGAHLYSPGTNLEQSERAQLETATRSVDVAMYSFTDRYLAEALAPSPAKASGFVSTGTANSSPRRHSGEDSRQPPSCSRREPRFGLKGQGNSFT